MKDRRIQSSVQKIAACDEQIEQCLAQFESRVDGDAIQYRAQRKSRRTPKGHQPNFDLGSHLYRITGGRVKISRTRSSTNRATTAFRLAAQSQPRGPSWIGSFYRCIRNRHGAPKAVTATAHKLARIFYHMWTTGEAYEDMDADAYDEQYKQRLLSNLQKQAKRMGFNVVLEPSTMPPHRPRTRKFFERVRTDR